MEKLHYSLSIHELLCTYCGSPKHLIVAAGTYPQSVDCQKEPVKKEQ
jgi:hypothetical protein